MELLFALFVGLYFIIRYVYEKLDKAERDRRYYRWKDDIDELERNVEVDYKLKDYIEEFIDSGEHFEEICDELSEDFEFIIGKNWRNELDIPGGNPSNTESHHSGFHEKWTYHLLLAKKGKIDSLRMPRYNFFGIRTQDMVIRHAQRVEKHLLEAGTELEIVLKPYSEYSTRLDGMKYDWTPCRGKLVFEQTLYLPPEEQPRRSLW